VYSFLHELFTTYNIDKNGLNVNFIPSPGKFFPLSNPGSVSQTWDGALKGENVGFR